MSLVRFSMAPSSAEAGLCFVCDGSACWLTALDNGIVCLPSVPAQLEVINTGNLIQRQETPLPPKEFKLNALLFFLAKSRFAGHSEPDVAWPGRRQWTLFQCFVFFCQSLSTPVWQTITILIWLLLPLYSWAFHSPLFQKPLLFNIPITPTGPEHSLWSGIFMESLFYLCVFFIFIFLLLLLRKYPP